MINNAKAKKTLILLLILLLCVQSTGCVTTRSYPKNLLKLSEDSLEKRQLQMRQFETIDEKEILSASAGVLQDMGFTLDNTEAELGLVVGSKNRDATDAAQVAMATAAVLLCALAGTTSNAYSLIDKEQKIRASIISKFNAEGNKLLVRVTFQRLVWNNYGNLSKVETLDDPILYQGFFDKLSKSIFLEGHKI